ncbi:MAG: thiamine phosphate synthase [Pseudomonadota bacterium]
MATNTDRCTLILLAHPGGSDLAALTSAVNSQTLQSCILYPGESSQADFSDYCQSAVPVLQDAGVAALIANDTRVLGRSKADGLFVQENRNQLKDLVARYTPDLIVGCGGFKDRHGAMEVGEAKPDFVFFGRLGGDIRGDAHPKNLMLSKWWADIIEIPSVVLAGSSLESIVDCALTGADFVAVESYAFAGDADPAEQLIRADEQLEQYAPRFEEFEA